MPNYYVFIDGNRYTVKRNRESNLPVAGKISSTAYHVTANTKEKAIKKVVIMRRIEDVENKVKIDSFKALEVEPIIPQVPQDEIRKPQLELDSSLVESKGETV